MNDSDQDRQGQSENSNSSKHPWTARRVAALIGIILLLAMYGSTMVFAVMGSPNAHAFLMASIYCTIAVPVLLYAITLTTKNLRGKGAPKEIPDAYREIKEKQAKEDPADSSSKEI